MKVLVVGAVAAGTKSAAALKRELGNNVDIQLICKDADISYAACGLPYYIGGIVKDRDSLLVHTSKSFEEIAEVSVETNVEAISLDRALKQIQAKDTVTGEVLSYHYDKLVIATGARAALPSIPGTDLEGVYVLRNVEDADKIKAAVNSGTVKRAVVVGGGMIGLELSDMLTALGIRTVIVDMASQILPGYDNDFAEYAENSLAENGIPIFLNDAVVSITGNGHVEKVQTNSRTLKTDLVIFAAGIKPNTEWLDGSGIELYQGKVLIDEFMCTNDPDVFACGDCAIVNNLITGERQWSPMGSLANIEGRLLARSIAGKAIHGFRGTLGTSIVKLPTLNIGKTGLTHTAAISSDYDAASITITCHDKPKFMPDSNVLLIRLTADKVSRRLLGVQAVGKGPVDKIIDIGVTAISLNASVDKLDDMEFAYAPPFSTAIHPFETAIHVLQNKLDGKLNGNTFKELKTDSDWIILDVGKYPVIPSLKHVDVSSINGPIADASADDKIALVCQEGKNSYLAQTRLKRYGYKNVYTVEGGTTFNTEMADDLAH